MTNSLQKHGLHEAHKQLSTRMKRDGLETIKVQVTRQAGKLKFDFTGSKDHVAKAQKILADWN
jgi:N-methylhydantoinase B/oxoprolinase/acetone carboxylase alpha subunit